MNGEKRPCTPSAHLCVLLLPLCMAFALCDSICVHGVYRHTRVQNKHMNATVGAEDAAAITAVTDVAGAALVWICATLLGVTIVLMVTGMCR